MLRSKARLSSPSRKKRRRFEHHYSAGSLDEAVARVKEGQLSINEAAARYSIPRSTVGSRLRKDGWYAKENIPSDPPLPSQIQTEVVIWLKKMAEIGCHSVGEALPFVIREVCEMFGEHTMFPIGNLPSPGYCSNFLEEQTNLPFDTKGNLSDCQGYKDAGVDTWLKKLRTHLEMCYGLDADGFLSGGQATSSQILCCHQVATLLKRDEGSTGKLVHRPVASSQERQRMMTMYSCVGAGGSVLRPIITVKNKVAERKYLSRALKHSYAMWSKEARMDSDTLLDWLQLIVDQVEAEDTSRPLMVFLDQSVQHISLATLDYCQINLIILFYLPGSSNFLKVSFFGLNMFLKLNTKCSESFRSKLNKKNLSKNMSVQLLSDAWADVVDDAIIRAEFKRVGIVPLSITNLKCSLQSSPYSCDVVVKTEPLDAEEKVESEQNTLSTVDNIQTNQSSLQPMTVTDPANFSIKRESINVHDQLKICKDSNAPGEDGPAPAPHKSAAQTSTIAAQSPQFSSNVAKASPALKSSTPKRIHKSHRLKAIGPKSSKRKGKNLRIDYNAVTSSVVTSKPISDPIKSAKFVSPTTDFMPSKYACPDTKTNPTKKTKDGIPCAASPDHRLSLATATSQPPAAAPAGVSDAPPGTSNTAAAPAPHAANVTAESQCSSNSLPCPACCAMREMGRKDGIREGLGMALLNIEASMRKDILKLYYERYSQLKRDCSSTGATVTQHAVPEQTAPTGPCSASEQDDVATSAADLHCYNTRSKSLKPPSKLSDVYRQLRRDNDDSFLEMEPAYMIWLELKSCLDMNQVEFQKLTQDTESLAGVLDNDRGCKCGDSSTNCSNNEQGSPGKATPGDKHEERVGACMKPQGIYVTDGICVKRDNISLCFRKALLQRLDISSNSSSKRLNKATIKLLTIDSSSNSPCQSMQNKLHNSSSRVNDTTVPLERNVNYSHMPCLVKQLTVQQPPKLAKLQSFGSVFGPHRGSNSSRNQNVTDSSMPMLYNSLGRVIPAHDHRVQFDNVMDSAASSISQDSGIETATCTDQFDSYDTQGRFMATRPNYHRIANIPAGSLSATHQHNIPAGSLSATHQHNIPAGSLSAIHQRMYSNVVPVSDLSGTPMHNNHLLNSVVAAADNNNLGPYTIHNRSKNRMVPYISPSLDIYQNTANCSTAAAVTGQHFMHSMPPLPNKGPFVGHDNTNSMLRDNSHAGQLYPQMIPEQVCGSDKQNFSTPAFVYRDNTVHSQVKIGGSYSAVDLNNNKGGCSSNYPAYQGQNTIAYTQYPLPFSATVPGPMHCYQQPASSPYCAVTSVYSNTAYTSIPPASVPVLPPGVHYTTSTVYVPPGQLLPATATSCSYQDPHYSSSAAAVNITSGECSTGNNAAAAAGVVGHERSLVTACSTDSTVTGREKCSNVQAALGDCYTSAASSATRNLAPYNKREAAVHNAGASRKSVADHPPKAVGELKTASSSADCLVDTFVTSERAKFQAAMTNANNDTSQTLHSDDYNSSMANVSCGDQRELRLSPDSSRDESNQRGDAMALMTNDKNKRVRHLSAAEAKHSDQSPSKARSHSTGAVDDTARGNDARVSHSTLSNVTEAAGNSPEAAATDCTEEDDYDDCSQDSDYAGHNAAPVLPTEQCDGLETRAASSELCVTEAAEDLARHEELKHSSSDSIGDLLIAEGSSSEDEAMEH